jgi:hypothetical protein
MRRRQRRILAGALVGVGIALMVVAPDSFGGMGVLVGGIVIEIVGILLERRGILGGSSLIQESV